MNLPASNPHQALQQATDTSLQAKGLLENAAFIEASNRLEAHYIDAWRKSKPNEPNVREDAWMMLRALEELKANLKVAAAAGGVVAFNLRRTITEKSA